MRGMGSFIGAALLAAGDMFKSAQRTDPAFTRTRGRKSNRWARGKKPALFNTREDAERAIRRAKRWINNQSKGPHDVPPAHILRNAELAAFQFGDDIAA